MTELRVPYLELSSIERAAEELLRAYAKWRGSPLTPPIDVDAIAEGYLKLELAVFDLGSLFGDRDVLGATFLEANRVVIDASLESKPGRFAFTLAHEIGHWQLHRPIVEMEKVTLPLFPTAPEGPRAPAVVCRSKQRKLRAEWQADAFAACLLMPASKVRNSAALVFGSRRPLCRQRPGRRIDARLRRAAREVIAEGGFENVSAEAMTYRLIDLSLVTVQRGLPGLA